MFQVHFQHQDVIGLLPVETVEASHQQQSIRAQSRFRFGHMIKLPVKSPGHIEFLLRRIPKGYG